jgi:hypothetical protein
MPEVNKTARRPRHLLVAVSVAVATVAGLGGCVPSRPAPTATSPHRSALVDPLSEVTDPRSPRYIDEQVSTLLHRRGTGPMTATIDDLGEGTRSVRFFVACSPDSHFTLTMTGYYSGPCGRTFENTGEIPLAPGVSKATVTLDLPRGVSYWLLAIPISTEEEVQ